MKIDKGIYTHCKRIPGAKIHTRPAILKKSNLTATLLVFRGTKLAVACRYIDQFSLLVKKRKKNSQNNQFRNGSLKPLLTV